MTPLERIVEAIESGTPFTYGGLSTINDAFGGNESRDRLADRTIQKYRRKGLIEFVRENGRVVWRPTDAGVVAFKL